MGQIMSPPHLEYFNAFTFHSEKVIIVTCTPHGICSSFFLWFYYYCSHLFLSTPPPAFLLLPAVRAFELSIPFVWNALFPDICMANWSHFHSILTKSHRFSETFLEYPVQNIIFSHPQEFTSSSLLYFSTWNITLSNISLIYWSCVLSVFLT